jgi:predicted phage terminase large subunit-like protein
VEAQEVLTAQQADKLRRRARALIRARDDLFTYLWLLHPDPDDPLDPDKARYDDTPQARVLCDLCMKVERGEVNRAAVSIGPQLGKSDIITRAFPTWAMGRNPRENVMVGAYNQSFAMDFGADVQAIFASDIFKMIFPDFALRTGSTAKDDMVTTEGGKLAFVGVGGSGTGKSAGLFIVDDPIRNDEDAQSQLYRDKLWKWFTSVVNTRMVRNGRLIIVHTRWSHDDLIGRLCDPDHPERNKLYKGISDRYRYINLPAVIDSPKLADKLGIKLEKQTDPGVIAQFGDKPIAALSPQRRDLRSLAESKELDSRVFGALFMGKPTPDDGEYFTQSMLVEYERDELPKNLRMYAASDHAVGMKQKADYTVLGVAGVDDKDDIWILPDLVWDRLKTDKMVDEMIRLMKRYTPMIWWAEDEAISKAVGPFLYKRMTEERVYTYIDVVPVAKTDKTIRARAIQGRMGMGKVRFPRFASWYANARSEMLKFPFGTHDDFVDFLAHIGAGMTKEIRASKVLEEVKEVERTGSIQWILKSAAARAAAEKRARHMKGW